MVGVTNGLMAYTASNETWKDGVRGEISGIEAWTASLDSLYATDAQLFQLYQATRSIELTTGSLIGITNGLMAFTASLDNTFATDVQLLPILQATRSLELLSGSLIGITNGLMAFTAALDSTYATDAQLYQLYQATQSLELHSGSMIGITNALMAFTAALDSTYATDAQLYQLYAETASIKAEIGGIEAYTASLKGAAIVSSSQQITNYYKFAETASANTFYGNQSISGSVGVNKSSNGGSGNDFPRLKVQNSLPTQGDGSSTFNFADILISSGNEAVNMFLATTYAAGSWAPSGIINVATNHGLQIKTNNTTALNIASGGDVTVSTGNLVIGTAGKGIDFSANTGGAGKSSQLLDDYEEGTLTGTITCGTSGTVTLDAGYNTLSYTKIGGVVHVFGNLSVTSVSSPVGYFTIPLPFACVNLGDSAGTTVANIVVNGTNAANTSDFVGWIDETQSNVIVRLGNATGVQNTSANELKALTDIYLQVTYRTT
jgi:hypothetical protein